MAKNVINFKKPCARFALVLEKLLQAVIFTYYDTKLTTVQVYSSVRTHSDDDSYVLGVSLYDSLLGYDSVGGCERVNKGVISDTATVLPYGGITPL